VVLTIFLLDVAHVLPILFPFTTPGKYCYRAMALFVDHVTKPPKGRPCPPVLLTPSGFSQGSDYVFVTSPTTLTPHSEIQSLPAARLKPRRSLTSGISRAARSLKRSIPSGQSRGLVVTPADTSASSSGYVTPMSQDESTDVAGPRIGRRSENRESGLSLAGEAEVYTENWSFANRNMIRERVSTRGVLRPLEPEDELPAMQVPSELIGTLSERAIRRYVTGKERFEKKFAPVIKRIEKKRLRNIHRASQDINQHIAALQHYLDRENKATVSGVSGTDSERTTAETLRAPSSWNMAWALDGDERPPPSSIVARRDTEEALKLARVADEAVLASEPTLSANNLWGIVINWLTVRPEGRQSQRETQSGHSPKVKAKEHVVGGRRRTGLRSILGRRQRSDPRSGGEGDEY